MKRGTESEKITLTAVFLLLCSLSFFSFSCKNFKNTTWDKDLIYDESYSDYIDRVDFYLNANSFQGALLIGKGESIIFAKGYGPCDKNADYLEPININSRFEIGSITKQMTAAAIMQQVEKKKIKLTDRLSKYFPNYVHGDEITIEMLLNMRSGLSDHINSQDDFFPKYIYRRIEKFQLANKPLEDNIVLTYFYDAPILAKPDSTYFYSNTNYYLLAKILEEVSGQSYYDYMEKHIFAPCGMNYTNIDFQNTDCRGYDYKDRYYSIPKELSFGCGDVNSSVTDLFKWNVLFTGGKVVNKKSLKKMLDTQSYGFGIYRRDNTIFHAGTTNVFNAYDFYSFDEKLSVIVLVNQPVSLCNSTFIAGKIIKIYKESQE